MFEISQVIEIIPFVKRMEVISGSDVSYDFVSIAEPFQVIEIDYRNGKYYWQNNNKVIETTNDFKRDCERLGFDLLIQE